MSSNRVCAVCKIPGGHSVVIWPKCDVCGDICQTCAGLDTSKVHTYEEIKDFFESLDYMELGANHYIGCRHCGAKTRHRRMTEAKLAKIASDMQIIKRIIRSDYTVDEMINLIESSVWADDIVRLNAEIQKDDAILESKDTKARARKTEQEIRADAAEARIQAAANAEARATVVTKRRSTPISASEGAAAAAAASPPPNKKICCDLTNDD